MTSWQDYMQVLERMLGCFGGMLEMHASPRCYSLNSYRTGMRSREEELGVRDQKASREEREHTQLSWSGMTCSCSFLLLL